MYPTHEEIKQFITLQHPSEYKISQGFGENKLDIYKKIFGMLGHNGIDYACPRDSEILASCRMEIVDFYLENRDKGYGTTVKARSEPFEIRGIVYRLKFIFGHLNSYQNITRNQWVDRGIVIAYSDNTGEYTTNDHLHYGVKLVKKGLWPGSWKTVDYNNGYRGYINPLPLTDIRLNLDRYNSQVVKSKTSPRHYIVKNGILYWYPDEVVFACDGQLFSEAKIIQANLILKSIRKTFEIPYDSRKTREVKQLLGLLANNSTRAKKLNKKYF